MKVEQLMQHDVKTCTLNDTLEAAARIMWEGDCGVTPVLDGEGRVLAMITDRDICMAGLMQGRPFWELPVSMAASKTLYSVRPTDSLETAQEIMRTHRIRRLPVIDQHKKLLGLVTLNDLARHAGRRADDLELEAVAKTLSAVCQPGHVSTDGKPAVAAAASAA